MLTIPVRAHTALTRLNCPSAWSPLTHNLLFPCQRSEFEHVHSIGSGLHRAGSSPHSPAHQSPLRNLQNTEYFRSVFGPEKRIGILAVFRLKILEIVLFLFFCSSLRAKKGFRANFPESYWVFGPETETGISIKYLGVKCRFKKQVFSEYLGEICQVLSISI